MSHQAVYDVLRALTDAGLVRRIQPSGSVARYEARVGDNHHHVVCRSCGAIADVDCAVGDSPVPDRRPTTHGFVIDEAEVIYWGRCPDVRSKRNQQPQPRTRYRRTTDVTEHGSESENPAIPAPRAQGAPAAHQPGLVARPAGPLGAAPALAAEPTRWATDFDYAEAVRAASTSRRSSATSSRS